jgi:hypothetical protein
VHPFTADVYRSIEDEFVTEIVSAKDCVYGIVLMNATERLYICTVRCSESTTKYTTRKIVILVRWNA